MADKYHYSSETLLDVKFEKNVRGYDPDEVDATLDKVIEDYALYEKFHKDAKLYIEKLEKKINELNETSRKQEIEVVKAKNALKDLKTTCNISESNIDLCRRIAKLEEALYKKGVDPTKIK